MIKHVLKLAFRNIFKNPETSFLNVLGLAIGMSVSIFVFTFLVYEFNYDKSLKDTNRKFRIISKLAGGDFRARSFYCFLDGLLDDVPEVENATAFLKYNEAFVNLNNIPLVVNDILIADTGFMQMFSVKVLKGNPSDIGTPNAMFITENEAERLFPGENPIGKEIYIKSIEGVAHWDSIGYYTIKGIVRSLEPNTHFRFNYLLSSKGHFDNFFTELRRMKIFGSWVYVKLAHASDKNAVEEKLQQIASKYLGNAFGPPVEGFIHELQPLRSIHNSIGMSFELGENRKKSNVYILGFIAFLILIVACMNFIILFTAKSAIRSVEAGIKKAIGASKLQLLIPYMVEVLIICIFAMLIAILIIENFAPLFNRLLLTDMHYTYFNIQSLVILAGTFVFTFLVTGSYSAVSFSVIQPIKEKKYHIFSKNHRGASLRSLLVVLQFIVSITLIAGMLTIRKQMKHINAMYLGYDNKNIIVLNLPH